MTKLVLLTMFLVPLVGCLSFHTGAIPGEPKNGTFANISGVRVHFADRGPQGAKTVVLLHGFAASMDTWKDVMAALEKRGFRVIALDLKGFGWTDRPDGDYSPQAQAKLVYELLDQRGVTTASFVAHSWGASVALAAAIAHPERVERLALYDAWVYEEQLPTFFHWARADGVGETMFALWYKERPDDKMAQAFYDPKLVTEKLVEDVEAALDRPGAVAAALAAVRGQCYVELQSKYRTIKKPTMLLWGREDMVTTLRFGERLSKELSDAKLVVYPQCGHFPMIEAAAASTADLITFLEPELAVVAPQQKSSTGPHAGGLDREEP